VTLTFARASREDPTHAGGFAAGALAANAILFPRVLLATAVLNPPLARDLAPRLAPALAVTALAAWVVARRSATPVPGSATSSSPLKVGLALQMAALFQAVLYVVDAAHRWFGSAGLVASAAVLGMTDVDALTLAMAHGTSGVHALGDAARAIGVGVLANTVVKLLLVIGLGSPGFRLTCAVWLTGTAAALLTGVLW
jgi:uncharacterized membrane protein (DUF4010 family)